MTAVLAALILSGPDAVVPTGYYTLSQLAKLVSTPANTVSVDPRCAAFRYGIRYERGNVEDLLETIAAEGSVTAIRDSSGWVIRSNAVSDRVNLATRSRYLEAVQHDLSGQFRMATDLALEGVRMPSESRQGFRNTIELDQTNDGEGSSAARRLACRFLDRDLGFCNLAVPNYILSRINWTDAATSYSTTLSALSDILAPDGHFAEAPYFRMLGIPTGDDPASISTRRRMLEKTPATLSAWLDPLSGNATFAMRVPIEYRGVSAPAPLAWGGLSSYYCFPKLSLERVLGPGAEGLHDRIKLDGLVRAQEFARKPIDIEVSSAPISDCLLRCCERLDLNCVLRPSRFAEPNCSVTPGDQISEILTRGSSSASMEAESALRLAERIGLGPSGEGIGRTTLPLLRTISVIKKCLVVRNELSFLDGFNDADPVLSDRIGNASVAGKKAALEDLCEAVANAITAPSANRILPDRFYRYCNPVTFHPFARLISSPGARKLVELVLHSKDQGFIPFAEFSRGERVAFERGLADVRNLAIEIGGQHSPEYLLADLAVSDPSKVRLSLARTQSSGVTRITVRILVPGAGGNPSGGERWSTWFQNVVTTANNPD